MLVIVAPGQGSGKPGALRAWLRHPEYVDQLAVHAEHTGLDLLDLAARADDTLLRDTAVAQPLLVAVGLAAARTLEPEATSYGAVAGHSVGELTAAALAGSVSDADAVRLAAVRGSAMARAAEREPTGMAAVVGGSAEAHESLAARHELVVANRNGPGLSVLAGRRRGLEALAQERPAGARVVPLAVAGAFHSRHMAPAVDAFRDAWRSVAVGDPRTPFVSNQDGAVVGSGHELADRLVQQVVRPVRWDLCMATLAELGASGVVELPPAGTVTAFVRRALPQVETLPLLGPEELTRVRAFSRRHGGLPSSARDDGATIRRVHGHQREES